MTRSSNKFTAIRDEHGRWVFTLADAVADLPTSGVPSGSLAWVPGETKFYAFSSGSWSELSILNAITADVTGNVTGNLTGGVTGNVTGNITGDVTGDVLGELLGAATRPSLKWLVAEVDFSVATEGAADTGLVLPVTGIMIGGVAVVTEALVGSGFTPAKVTVAPSWSQLTLYDATGTSIAAGAGTHLSPNGGTIDLYSNDNAFSGASVTVEPLDASNLGGTMASGKVQVRLLVCDTHSLGISGGA